MLLSGLREKKYEMPTKFLSSSRMTESKTGGSGFIVKALKSEPLPREYKWAMGTNHRDRWMLPLVLYNEEVYKASVGNYF